MEQRIKTKKGDKEAATTTKGVTSVIQAELELNGRRLVIMEAMGKDEKTNTVQPVEDKKK